MSPVPLLVSYDFSFARITDGDVLDLDLLPTFAALADTGSFTASARRLGLTQPAVHGQVRRLTESVGEPLYVRAGRGIALTARGLELARLAREVVRARDAFLAERAPALRLAAGRGTWAWVLTGALQPWVREASIQPVLAEGPDAEDAVLTGRAELGVAVDPSTRLPSVPLCTVGSALLVPLDHPLAARASVPWRDLPEGPWILPSAGRPHRIAVADGLERAGVRWSLQAEVDDWWVTARLVGAGLGVSVVNDFVTSPTTRTIPLRDGPTRVYRLFWRPGARPDAVDALPVGP